MVAILVRKTVFISLFIFFTIGAVAQHPSLLLTQKNLAEVVTGVAEYPLLKKSFASLKALADEAVKHPINVPVPKDGGGGFTHEQHKRNYQYVLACGIAYQITK